MNPFEIAQIANLAPNDAEEAKALIPTCALSHDEADRRRLARLDDDALNAMLAEVQDLLNAPR